MLKNIDQNDRRLLKVIQKYGCYFLCLAEQSPLTFEDAEGCRKLNYIWEHATALGYISGDLNQDGDYDDVGEAEILDATSLCREFFSIFCHYDGVHHDAEENIPSDVAFAVGKFFWKGGHFVLINRRKEVTFDSLGYSNTVKNGTLKSMRWYYAD